MPRRKRRPRSVERHKTAAWADAQEHSPLSRAPHPSLQQTVNAKEYVDVNEK